MRILIIEDEPPALKRLKKQLQQSPYSIEIVECLDSVEHSVNYLKNFNEIDLIFMDIQLGDGLSFDIFTQVDIQIPVIFTTAYDQYMMKAFKVNSIDYLLKPIDNADLQSALEQFNNLKSRQINYNVDQFNTMIQNLIQKDYKSRFLIKQGGQLQYINTTEIQYFYFEEGYVHLVSKQNKTFIVEYTLEQLNEIIDPNNFFRINRKIIINIGAIHKISPHFNGRLKIKVEPNYKEEIIVSRERVSSFKAWLNK